MHYVDTCVLLAYLLDEPFSKQANQVFCDEKRYPLAISAWTETELFSALGIKCRTKQLTETQSQLVQEQFTALRAQFIWLPITASEYSLATDLLKHWQTGLRAGDALHLAVAKNHNAMLLSLDEVLVKAAKQFAIAAEDLRHSA